MIYKETDKYRIAKFGGKVYWCNQDVDKFGILHTTKSTIEEIEKELGDNSAESNVEAHKKEIFRKIEDVMVSENRRKIKEKMVDSLEIAKGSVMCIKDILNTYENKSITECEIEIIGQLDHIIVGLFDIEYNLEKFI